MNSWNSKYTSAKIKICNLVEFMIGEKVSTVIVYIAIISVMTISQKKNFIISKTVFQIRLIQHFPQNKPAFHFGRGVRHISQTAMFFLIQR